jgi:hypothetical protein
MLKVLLTEDEKRDLNRHYMDPNGWKVAQQQLEHELQSQAHNLLQILEWIGTDDPDAKPLRDALKRALRTRPNLPRKPARKRP